jgi:hypothetical protein
VPRDEKDTPLVADIDGQRDAHIREDDDVLERDKEKCGHLSFRFHLAYEK